LWVARRKKQKKKSKASQSQKMLVFVVGLALAVCAASVAVSVKNWYSRGEENAFSGEFRFEVLNGTTKKGLAREVALALIKKNIDVFRVDNADRDDYQNSILIARKETSGLELMGKELGCVEYMEQLQSDTMVDATLIIGADYRNLNLGREYESSLLE
jgi:hypothetical protein